jgi:hypothetical protein
MQNLGVKKKNPISQCDCKVAERNYCKHAEEARCICIKYKHKCEILIKYKSAWIP